MASGFEGLKQVGEYNPPRQPITGRTKRNPIDVCTIVSIYPRKFEDTKLGLQPGKFTIPPGSYENPSIIHVGSSSWWLPGREEGQPSLEIPVFSINMAESLIKDYVNGMLEYNEDCSPGFFFIEGKVDLATVKRDYKDKLDEVRGKQNNWYRALVRTADSLFARSGGNPRAIGDEMRLAADELGLRDKPWLQDFKQVDMVPCSACGEFRNPLYPVCGKCGAIDQSHPNAKDLVFNKK